MSPSPMNRVKLAVVALLIVAGSAAFSAENGPGCSVSAIFNSQVRMPNVDLLTDSCINCGINPRVCTASAYTWCLSQEDKCTNASLGCKDRLGSTCPAEQSGPPKPPTLPADDDLRTFDSTPACPSWMITKPNKPGMCFCNSNDNDGATVAGGSFMPDIECNEKYKSPPGTPPKSRASAPPSSAPPSSAPPPASTKPPVDNAACNAAKKSAQDCCNNPSSCVDMSVKKEGPSSGESIQAFCKRTQSAGFSDGTNKSNASETCQVRINNCNSSCGGNDSSCNSLQSQVQSLARLGLNSFGQSDWGRYCQELTNAQPQSASPGGGSPGGGSPGGGSSGDGSPTAAEQAAQKAIEAINNAAQGKSEFKDYSPDKAKEAFNVPDSPAPSGNFGPSGASPLDKLKGGGQQGTVANNSGGQIPGSGGDSGGAKIGGGRGTGSPGSPGYSTDVLQGFQNGGGGAAGGGSTDTNGKAGEGFSGYGGARGPSSVRDKMDLKKYLPGGELNLGSKLGGLRPFSREINGRHVNLWNKVSDRFQEKCRLGELIDCR